MSEGDVFEGLDGHGKIYLCRLTRSGPEWRGEVIEELEERRESPLRVTLALSMIKPANFEWALQKSAELGVGRIVPVQSQRSEVRLRTEKAGRWHERWLKIVAESVKQSGRSRIPRLERPLPMEDFCRRDRSQLRFVLDEAGKRPLGEMLDSKRRPSDCCFLVGPEGGWDVRDRQIFEREEWTRVGLGPRTLRAETSPIVVLSILQWIWGDLNASGSAADSG